MPTQQDITKARDQATQSSSVASEYASGTYNVESILKQKLNDAYKSNQDIVGKLDQSTADYLSAPSVAREKYQNIFNPFSREKLVSQYTNQEAIPMQTYSNLLGSRKGSIADTINAGVGGFQAQASAAQGQANIDRTTYQDLLSEFQSNRDYQLQMAKFNADQQEGSSISDLFKTLQGADTGGNNMQKDAIEAAMLNGDISATVGKYFLDQIGAKEDRTNLLGRLNKLTSDIGGISSSSAFTGMGPLSFAYSDPESQKGKSIKTAIELTGMEVARMFESGRMSDKDREFYLNNWPKNAEIIINPAASAQKAQAVVNYFEDRYGKGGGETQATQKFYKEDENTLIEEL